MVGVVCGLPLVFGVVGSDVVQEVGDQRGVEVARLDVEDVVLGIQVQLPVNAIPGEGEADPVEIEGDLSRLMVDPEQRAQGSGVPAPAAYLKLVPPAADNIAEMVAIRVVAWGLFLVVGVKRS